MTMFPATAIVWLEFALCAAVIAIAGAKCRATATLSLDKTGLGGA